MSYGLPRKFKIGGQEIKIITKKAIDREGAIGEYSSHENLIYIQTHLNGKALPVSQIRQTFCHEFMHCLFDHCRQEELCANEELVDLMGEFLMQSLGPKLFK